MALAPSPRPEQPPQRSSWRYGEHVSVIGDTGSGKTFLISKLVQSRKYVVIIRTKPDDISFPGFDRRKNARSMDNLSTQRILLDPDYHRQREEAASAMERAWIQGGWTVVIDELLYIEKLKLTWSVDRLLTQGRSKKISTVVGMQRPVSITRWAISQSTHVFCFNIEGRDIATMAESTSPRVAKPLVELDNNKHDFVYFNRRTRQIATGNANRLGEIIVGADGIY